MATSKSTKDSDDLESKKRVWGASDGEPPQKKQKTVHRRLSIFEKENEKSDENDKVDANKDLDNENGERDNEKDNALSGTRSEDDDDNDDDDDGNKENEKDSDNETKYSPKSPVYDWEEESNMASDSMVNSGGTDSSGGSGDDDDDDDDENENDNDNDNNGDDNNNEEEDDDDDDVAPSQHIPSPQSPQWTQEELQNYRNLYNSPISMDPIDNKLYDADNTECDARNDDGDKYR